MGGGQATREVEPDTQEQDVDEHPDVGLRDERAPVASREEVGPVQEEPEEREERDAAREGRGLDRERELERHDDQGDAAADRELLIEPQSAAELSLGRVLVGPLERGTSVNRPDGFRRHSIFGCEGGATDPGT